MKAYLDSGVFIDYLVGRGHAGLYLRTAARRGRSPQQLGADAEACLARLSANHAPITSVLTCHEVEEALYRELKRSAIGVAHGDRFIIPAARAVTIQVLVSIDLFGVQMLDLTIDIVNAQCRNLELQKQGTRSADALHVTTAIMAEAELLITADDDILKLDRLFSTGVTKLLRCVDTDTALTLVP